MKFPKTMSERFPAARFQQPVLRVIDSLQLTAKHKVATPVNWKQGEDVIIAGSVTDEDAKKQYPQGWKASFSPSASSSGTSRSRMARLWCCAE
jgi:C-terminal domain of 1-Cys peroxiredoxin